MALTPRRTSAVPIPSQELERLRTTLSPHYGGQVWEGAGHRILVVRVPRPEPDLIQDIEAAIDYLDPDDVHDLSAALLVGDAKTHAVPTQPFHDLMQQRVAFDQQQATELRKRLAPGSHWLYRAPGDARRIVRLALRLHQATVEQATDDDWASWSEILGADLQSGKLAGVRAVYVVADNDYARLDADAFLHDLRRLAGERRERQAMAQQLANKQAKPPATVAGTTQASGGPGPEAQAPARLEGIPASETGADPSALQQLREALEASGFDVLLHPKTRHRIDLAAERAQGDVQRVIVRIAPHATLDLVQDLLEAARAVEADAALAVAPTIDVAARKRLIATKARWLRPEDLGQLAL